MSTQTSLPSQTNLRIAFTLAMVTALGPLAIDTYLPAFPAMADSLSVRVHDISLSIPVYIIMLAISQLIGGPLSDQFGRRTIMLSGLAIFSVASILLSQCSSIEGLLVLRSLQAFGGGWAMVCVPALVRDRLQGAEAARFFSLIGLIVITAPALAPSIGSAILYAVGWPGIFIFLAAYALVLIPVAKRVIFAKSPRPPVPPPKISTWQRYKTVFATRPALRYMLLQALGFSVMLIFITHSAFIYQEHFGASPGLFSLLFGANILALVVMNLLNRRLLRSKTPQWILRRALTLQGLATVALIICAATAAPLWLFTPSMMIAIGAMGAVTPNTQACYMDYFGESGGTASAAMGAVQYALAGLIAGGSALLASSVMTAVVAQALCSLVCVILIWTNHATPPTHSST